MKAPRGLVPGLALVLRAVFLLDSPSRAADGDAPRALSDRSLADAGRLLLFDMEGMLTAPARWDGTDWSKVGFGAASVTAVESVLDETVRKASQRNRSVSRDAVATQVARFGAEYSWVAIGSFLVAGWAFDDAKSRRVAVDAVAASVIASGIVATAERAVVGG